jgi:hypothetical protein
MRWLLESAPPNCPLLADIVAKVQNARDYFCRQMRIQAAIADGYTLKSVTEVAGESIMR